MSTLRVNTIQNASGGSAIDVPGAAKAWVNFNGTGTVAIRGSLNVSSITDNGVGSYNVNFATAMPDTNYAVTLGAGDGTSSGSIPFLVALSIGPYLEPANITTSTVRVFARVPSNGAAYDLLYANVSINR